MDFDSLHSALLKTTSGAQLFIEWANGTKIKGQIDTTYETDNLLEMDDPNYLEYYACSFRVGEVLKSCGLKDRILEEGHLIEVSIIDPPDKVSLKDGTVVWENPHKGKA